MKIRTGFVSNSSSTSFCVVGISSATAKELLMIEAKELLGKKFSEEAVFENFSHGHFYLFNEKKTILEYYGTYDEVDVAGIQAEDLLETCTLPQARVFFKKLVKDKFGVDIPVSSIELLFGEAGEG